MTDEQDKKEDQRFKTIRHIETVRNCLNEVIRELLHRAEQHDQSKLQSPEREVFDEYTQKLRGCTYGSDEYKQFIREMSTSCLKHHYKNNRHHPEYFKLWKCVVCKSIIKDEDKLHGLDSSRKEGKYYCPLCGNGSIIYETELVPATGVLGMNLIDVIEMFVDWYSATKRHADGDIYKSIQINKENKLNNSDTLEHIFKNTADWITAKNIFNHAEES